MIPKVVDFSSQGTLARVLHHGLRSRQIGTILRNRTPPRKQAKGL
jgi:hypothetical protein